MSKYKNHLQGCLVGMAGLGPATNRLCAPQKLSLPLSSLRFGLSLHPRGMPAVQSLHLSLNYLQGLGSGLPLLI
jgi:hypothetical protein